MPKTVSRSGLARGFLLLALIISMAVLCPSQVSAIPAWSRQYDVPCSTCHYPAPPRLNAYGHKFRRAQFRLPDEFNKDPDWRKLANYMAMRVRARYEYDSPEEGFGSGTVTNSFKLNDATLFYAGPVSKNFSGFVELERPGDEEIVEAVVSIGGIRGKPDSFWTFRLGQFHTLTRVGFGGLDRPTGISTPNALSRALVSGNDFRLNQDQVGVEGTYVYKNHRFIGQILNGSDITVDSTGAIVAGTTTAGSAGTTDRADQNRDKDYVFAYELMWGETASGLTAFYYDGTQDKLDDLTAPDVVSLKRYGVTASQVWKNGFELQGGYVVGTDDYKSVAALGDSVDGSGYWVEVAKYWGKAKDVTVFGRFDSNDPNDDVDDNSRDQVTLGFVFPVAGWHLRWAVELRDITQESTTLGELSDRQGVAELMLNF